MELRILGPVAAYCGGEQIPLPGSKINTVLSALLVARGQSVPYTELSRYLWGRRPPATMRAQIYSYVYKLRQQLGDGVRLRRQNAGYVLDPLDAALDVAEFERLTERGRQALESRDYAIAEAELRAALALWRGPALANVTEHLAAEARSPLEEAWATATEQRIDAGLALRRHADLIPHLTGLVDQFPLRERFRAQLILALHRGGCRAEALLSFQHGRRLLAERLGAGPGPALTEAWLEALRDDEPAASDRPPAWAR